MPCRTSIRDPEIFPNPNEFDIRRNPNLGLSRGISPG